MIERVCFRWFLPAIATLFLMCGAITAGAQQAPGLRSLPAARRSPPPSSIVVILNYHDISDARGVRPETVPASLLRDQIRRCKEEGWTFLPLSELLSYKDRPDALPPRAVVVTFDDAYRSFFEQALPILREEGVKATLAVITSFIDRPPPGMPPLMTWDQIKEADRSGFVEIASHSHDLHKYVTSNPYRDTAPSVVTRRYLLQEARYEDRNEYLQRIREDLKESQRILREKLGHDVSVLAWPYGEYNAASRGIAAEEGFRVTLGLGGIDVRPEDLRSGLLPRVMVAGGSRIGGKDPGWIYPSRMPVRAAQVDLDGVYDPDPDVFSRKVDRMVEKVRGMGATHVFLQAFPDSHGSAFFRDAWFQNHQVPVRADIWSMVANRLSHAGVRVWIRAPSMNLSWAWAKHPEWRIPFRRKKGGKDVTPWYFRLSPDISEARAAAVDFFTDVAVYLPIEGVLFDDDAYMLAGEKLKRSRSSSPREKSEAIRGLIEEIKAAVLAWRPGCLFGRNLYAPAVEKDGAHPDFSQDLGQFLRDYDLTVVMAYARMEGRRKDAERWVESMARRVIRKWSPPKGRELEAPPVMFKFQAYDWAEEEWVPPEELAGLVAAARRAMVLDLGVYPVLPDEGNIPKGLLGEAVRPGSSDRY
jgi:poly-beta-1,6-N-acetyl-D-glucosamine N-deacetylase